MTKFIGQKDKYINDLETMILNWLKSDSENATVLACEIAEYICNVSMRWPD